MSIRYYKLFDLLNRRDMKKSDLLEIISSKTIAKLSKGANVNTDIIDKICLHLNCQPSDIMEVVRILGVDEEATIYGKEMIIDTFIGDDDKPVDETYSEVVVRDNETGREMG